VRNLPNGQQLSKGAHKKLLGDGGSNKISGDPFAGNS
jgi:hypothetical protein